MVNGDDNNLMEKTDQSDLSDEGVLKPSDEAISPQDEMLKSDTTSSDSHADAGQGSGDSMESVMNLYEESFKRFAEGEVVTGRIISIDKDHVLVDIGYKSEGQIRIQEFKNDEGEVTAQLGDSVEVMVEWWDDEEERVVLSKEKAANIKIWDAIKKSYDEDGTVEGVISNRVKGGFSVDIGVQAFLPGSQADLRPIRNRIDAVIDGSIVPGKPSSVISLINDIPEVIREGIGDVRIFE